MGRGMYRGKFCQCGEELITDEEKANEACYCCMYQSDGDADDMPPRYEPHGKEK